MKIKANKKVFFLLIQCFLIFSFTPSFAQHNSIKSQTVLADYLDGLLNQANECIDNAGPGVKEIGKLDCKGQKIEDILNYAAYNILRNIDAESEMYQTKLNLFRKISDAYKRSGDCGQAMMVAEQAYELGADGDKNSMVDMIFEIKLAQETRGAAGDFEKIADKYYKDDMDMECFLDYMYASIPEEDLEYLPEKLRRAFGDEKLNAMIGPFLEKRGCGSGYAEFYTIYFPYYSGPCKTMKKNCPGPLSSLEDTQKDLSNSIIRVAGSQRLDNTNTPFKAY
ncbi:MAG: hypothetical protein ABIA04_11740 [Pseudomonadota bacterium]